MPFSPKSYGLVQPPQATDLMQSLAGLMQMGRQMEGFEAEQKERARTQRTEKAFNDAKGDPTAAAGLLEKQGDWVGARALRDKTQAIRENVVNDVMTRLNSHKTAFGQAEQVLTELQARPELYPEVRPKLVELAASVDPSLAQHIPEQYDPLAVRNQLTWVKATAQATDQRLRAAQVAHDKVTAKENLVKGDNADRKIVSDWFSVSPNQDDWNQSIAAAKALGVSDTLLSKVGPTWSKASLETARQIGLEPKDRKKDVPNTFAAAILEARDAGDTAGVESLIKLQDRTRDKSNDPTPVTPGMIAAVAKNPTLWGELSPTVRDKMLGPLSAQNFDFSAATSAMTPAQKAAAERWKTEQLEQLEKEIGDRTSTWVDDGQGGKTEIPPLKAPITPEQIAQRKDSIQKSYLTQIGASAGATAKPGRTATKEEIQQVATRAGITYADAKKQLAAEGVTEK